MSLEASELAQTITIETTFEEGGLIGVARSLSPGFPDLADEEEFIAKTLISVLWDLFPAALHPTLAEHLDQVTGRE